MSETNKSLEELIAKYPKYYGGTTSIKAKDNSFRKKMAMIFKQLKDIEKNVPITDEITIDGHRINFSDNSWVLVRSSGTEPKIRIVADAKTKERADKLTLAIKELVINIIGQENLLK